MQELPSKYAVKATQSCVDFVLPKVFQCIILSLSYTCTAKQKMKSRAICVCVMKGIFGEAFRCALLVVTIILISYDIFW